jgi:hypothetical protein
MFAGHGSAARQHDDTTARRDDENKLVSKTWRKIERFTPFEISTIACEWRRAGPSGRRHQECGSGIANAA